MSPTTKGPISQRELLKVMLDLIDAARAKNSSMHKDEARKALQTLLSNPEVNWRTTYVMKNLSDRRCRYLNSIGFWTLSRWSNRGWTGPVAEKVDDD